MNDRIYRVTVKRTISKQPGGDTYWTRDVIYCGPSLLDARVAYLREVAMDVSGSYGNPARDTVIEGFAADPDDIDDTTSDDAA